jgi:hypothetical protein
VARGPVRKGRGLGEIQPQRLGQILEQRQPATGVSPSQAGVAWPAANDADPVVQDFVRCCLDNKPAQAS